ncbi:MAG: transaldolase [Candidatus Binatia bacterium]
MCPQKQKSHDVNRKESIEKASLARSPLRKLQTFGQSIWLDFIRRGMLASGELDQLIKEDGLSGITSNPTIFEKAIAGSHDYDEAIRSLVLERKTVDHIYRVLAVEDVRRAADLFHPIYERQEGRDGFVSLEVSPYLAHDTAGTIAEAKQLWTAVDRRNVLIKVPATPAGLPAIRQLISEGINVNVTLLFSLSRYQEVVDAHMAGLEQRAGRGLALHQVSSVASFFLSRIDVLVDSLLEKIAQRGGPEAKNAAALRGRVAVASAKVAYQAYKEIVASRRFQALAAKGACAQRLLWASTSTKNPAYSDVKYVGLLIGPETIATLSLETLSAYRDHGRPDARLQDAVAEAHRILQRLAEVGIDLRWVTQQLEDEGVRKFSESLNALKAVLKEKCAAVRKEGRVDLAT